MNDKIKKTIADHKELVDAFERTGIDAVIKIAQAIIDCFKNGGKVYLCGNGGSAADCQHIAAEMVGRFQRDRKAMPAVALSTDTSLITSVGNDYGFGEIFRRQVEGLVNKGDILWAFSTSGKSPNIISAAKLAKEKKATVISFTGKKDSELEKISDLCFCIDSPGAASAQEIHQLAYHIICDLVEEYAGK